MSGARMPTWKERENNKRRERRRRAISAKIFAGLRMYGNYNLPKHCDCNEVLKALADEAGWTVEPDGTTYRKQGCKPPEMTHTGGSVSASPGSSYQPSPYGSCNHSPPSSIASPTSSPFGANPHPDSLIPWLKDLSSSGSASKAPHFRIQNGSMSAPVTSPTARSPPRIKTDYVLGTPHLPYLPSSSPPSPAHETLPNHEWYSGTWIPQSGPTSPTFSLVAANPFGFNEAGPIRGGSRMWTPGQSGTCSPANPIGFDNNPDIPMAEVVPDEFAFRSNAIGRVKPWEGEMIHEESVLDDLELTLGSSKTRYVG
ncbi:hypothetical protein M8C21_013370 [Ambrosia artemisiifolia]|uniref:Protein BZR1 homolog n=1 Tax=Ambrosia artemisiifolia TaxID=4212 RepID=A0AAD5CYA7_AMBAR|nr:hypothetical protein M8C21_013370 [Ambrosia artemisiifolia]